MNITRDIIIDLWPVYTSGEASADTRAFVEEFLRDDPELSQLLKESEAAALLKAAVPALPPDREVQALNRTKKLLHGWDWSFILMLLSINFTAQAFARIISDTSWDVSPRNFIIMAVIAAGFWSAFIIRLLWVRRKVYRNMAGRGS